MADEQEQSAPEFEAPPLSSLFGTNGPEFDVDDNGKVDRVQPAAKTEETEKSEPTDEAASSEKETKPEESTDDETATGDETGETDAPPASSEDKKDEITVPLGALEAERNRRKVVEAELEALKANPAPTVEAQTQTPFHDLPSIHDGEAQFQQGMSDLAKREARQVIFEERLSLSENAAVEEYGKDVVQAAIDKMTPQMKDNPEYVKRFRQAREPYVELVKMAADIDKASKLTDPNYVSKWEAEKEKEIEARIRTELEEAAKKEADLDATIPDSLSGRRSSGDLKSGTPHPGQKPLNELFKKTG